MDGNAVSVDSKSMDRSEAKRRSWKKPLLILLTVLLVAVLSLFAYLVYDDQYVKKGHFFEGTKIAGIDVSTKSRSWANKEVRARIADPLLAPLTVGHGSRSWRLETSKFARVDVEGMTGEAYAAGWNKGLFDRLYVRWFHKPLNVDVKTRFTFDEARITQFVARLAKEINRPPVDAKQIVVKHKLKILPSKVGFALNRKRTIAVIEAAMPTGRRNMKLKAIVLNPKITRKNFKKAIFINLSENMLYLYNYEKIIQSYPVATGQGGFPTPVGDWKIMEKRENPTWYNPHMAWSAGMPESIGPGPGNPLGTRALNLDANGIRIHGTYSDGSIGSYASHGCIRMHISDSVDLFPRVDVGTPVYIRW